MSTQMERLILLAIIASAVACLALTGRFPPEKTLNGAGVMFDMAGVVQLHLTGLFSTVVRDYFDKVSGVAMLAAAPPNGRLGRLSPRGAGQWMTRQLFVAPRTGYLFILLGFGLQWIAVWL